VQTNSPEWRASMNTPRSPVITLFRSHLVAADACGEGLAMFDEYAALQGRTKSLRLTWAHMLWAACDERSRAFVTWAQEMGLLPRFNLRGADLGGANLSGANLYGANLYGANLSRANLYGADLRDANLRSANLSDANLSGANLSGANLYGANLSGANLSGANLYGANLSGANLYGANLSGCSRWSHDPALVGWTLTAGVLVPA